MPPIEFRDALISLRWRMASLFGQFPIWIAVLVAAPVGTVGYVAVFMYLLITATFAYHTFRPATPRTVPDNLPEPAREAVAMANDIGGDLGRIEFWISQPTQIQRGVLRLQNQALKTSDIAAVRASMAYAMFLARVDGRRGFFATILGAGFYVTHPLFSGREAALLARSIWIGAMLVVLGWLIATEKRKKLQAIHSAIAYTGDPDAMARYMSHPDLRKLWASYEKTQGALPAPR